MRPVDDERAAFYSLALRYLTGEATGDERERLVALLQQPDLKKMFEEMDAAWSEDPENWNEGFDLEGATLKVTEAIAKDRMPSPAHESAPSPAWADRGTMVPKQHAQQQQRRRWWQTGLRRRYMALTASAAVMAVIAVTFLVVSKPNLATGRATGVGADAGNLWVEQANGIGERLMLTLGDGTKITLNAGSSLRYPKTFGARNRAVRLAGEAYFDVAHDQARPFIVETSTLRITVLGTRFNVKAFPDGTKAQVTLVQGKVEVTPVEGPQSAAAAAAKPVTLTSGMQYSLAQDTRTGQVTTIADESGTGWMSDKITWNREPLPDAMRELERRYGITVELADQRLLAETVTGRFQSESIQAIFTLLHATGGIDYRLVENNGKVERVILRYVSTGKEHPPRSP
ncbi:DUF4974 domain-containing protein [Opitutaceae bacterium TAV4]|nr:DUF4974 domain-containing protein [Opitutaceae bacterium TAV4]RRK02110.1 DUF4974 domain-containing protein [Opitutaceae bacterium TAV3]